MKVGQVTFCGDNFGSVLQCYATQKVLQQKGIETVLLQRKERGIGRVVQSLEFRACAGYKYLRYPKYRDIFAETLKISRGTTVDEGLDAEASICISGFISENIRLRPCSWKQLKQLGKSKEYTAFFSGSDQIWNGKWFITNRLWFLRFAPKNKRVAWMPSLGGQEVYPYNIRTYKKYISDYCFLSARESEGSRVISQLTGRETPVLADPVLLLDENVWRQTAASVQTDKKYILMFFLDRPSDLALETAEQLKAATGCSVIYFSYKYENLGGGEQDFLSGGPAEFISMIDKASFVLTDSFHACLFSIVLTTPFFAFSRSSSIGASQVSRVKNLLERFGMEDRLVAEKNGICDSDFFMDAEKIKAIIQQERKSAEDYLERVLSYYSEGAQ